MLCSNGVTSRGDALATLPFGPPTERTVHLCIDMQNIFALETPWHTPWMVRVLPVVTRIAEHHPQRTIFTRFISPQRPEQMSGSWRPILRALARADIGTDQSSMA